MKLTKIYNKEGIFYKYRNIFVGGKTLVFMTVKRRSRHGDMFNENKIKKFLLDCWKNKSPGSNNKIDWWVFIED